MKLNTPLSFEANLEPTEEELAEEYAGFEAMMNMQGVM